MLCSDVALTGSNERFTMEMDPPWGKDSRAPMTSAVVTAEGK